jgi:hypothetical protein
VFIQHCNEVADAQTSPINIGNGILLGICLAF